MTEESTVPSKNGRSVFPGRRREPVRARTQAAILRDRYMVASGRGEGGLTEDRVEDPLEDDGGLAGRALAGVAELVHGPVQGPDLLDPVARGRARIQGESGRQDEQQNGSKSHGRLPCPWFRASVSGPLHGRVPGFGQDPQRAIRWQ